MGDVVRASGTTDVSRARGVVLDRVVGAGVERVGIVNALGRTLAAPIVAEVDVPACDTALKAGFAAIAADTVGATEKEPRALSVLAARITPRTHVTTGTTVPISPGDALPYGADTVITAPRCYRPTDDPQVLVLAEAVKRENVRPASSLIKIGEALMDAGAVIGSRDMGMLAALGIHGIQVSRRPRVAVVTTGAEIVDLMAKLEPGEIRNSARYSLVGMVLEAGCDLGGLVHVRDGRPGLERAITGTSSSAVIVALGPHEKHDSAVQALRNTGEVLFERLNIQPGSASAFGIVSGKPVFIVPAEYALEAFEVVIRPALLAMLGRTVTDRPIVQARIGSTLKLNPGYRHYIRSTVACEADGHAAKPLTPGLGGVRPWTQPNGLVIVPENAGDVHRGDVVEVVVLG